MIFDGTCLMKIISPLKILDPGIGGVCKVQLDHLDVCKPRHRGCFLYRQLANMIKNAMNTHIVQFQRDDFKGHS